MTIARCSDFVATDRGNEHFAPEIVQLRNRGYCRYQLQPTDDSLWLFNAFISSVFSILLIQWPMSDGGKHHRL
jgi:hypothetical protein